MLSRDLFYPLGRTGGGVDKAEGYVARDISAATDMMYVVCEDISAGEEIGPIPWPGPIGDLMPVKGDRAALLVIDDIWCIGWWPNG